MNRVASFGNPMLIVKIREHWHVSGDCCLPHSPGQFGEASGIDTSNFNAASRIDRGLRRGLRLGRVKCFEEFEQRCFIAICQFEFCALVTETKSLFHVGPQNL
jgi:hypothetical protein